MNVSKSCFGWKAESVVNLTDSIRLCFVTMKRSSGALTTTVQGSKKETLFADSDCPREMWYYTVLQDYNKAVRISNPARVTQKTVEQQMAEALTMLDDIVADAKTFYKVAA